MERQIGELKTKVKIVKVPRTWTVARTLSFYRSLPGVVYAEPNYLAAQHGLAAGVVERVEEHVEVALAVLVGEVAGEQQHVAGAEHLGQLGGLLRG